MSKLRFSVAFLLVFSALILPLSTALAGICDEFTGQAFGLCQAGVAVGCDTQTGSAQACAKIEEKFLTATGMEVPWLAVCPCDLGAVSLALQPNGPWDADQQRFSVQCDDYPDTSPGNTLRIGVFADSFGNGGRSQGYKLKLAYNSDDGSPTTFQCALGIQGTILDEVTVNSSNTIELLNMARTCRTELVAYATAFIALHPKASVNTLGCPELTQK